MDGFSYLNIFSTKGVEYLIVIGFFIVVIPFWRLLKETEMPRLSLSAIRLPRGVYFDATHTWAYLERAGKIRVGIDDFITALTGPVTLKLNKHRGETIKRGEHIATLMGDDKSLKIYSPISGTLKSINKSALKIFSKRTNHEFTENWLFDMEPKRWDMEKTMLILGEKAQEWIRKEHARLRDVLAFAELKYNLNTQPVLLQEGGEIADQVLEPMSSEIWEEFQSEFIDAVKN
ncbi:MAG: hypothetical protein ISR87_04010 [Candidatus Marinimicrobia bacterium]|nr:hypothetical protein [FCB group bacterium]MBL7024598.1 hypothetical protein [Candidatus Neomarinimicrobiota bacterium]